MNNKPKCTKCSNTMLELEQDTETMSDGQISDYEAGFNLQYMCPSCGHTTVADSPRINDEPGGGVELKYKKKRTINKVRLENKQKNAKLNIMRGDFNEYLARKHYESKGYICCKMVQYFGRQHKLNADEVKMFFELSNTPINWHFIRGFAEISVAGLPDFILLKDGNIKFVECKSSLEQLNSWQKRCHQALAAKGYEVDVFCTKVDLSNLGISKTSVYTTSLDSAG